MQPQTVKALLSATTAIVMHCSASLAAPPEQSPASSPGGAPQTPSISIKAVDSAGDAVRNADLICWKLAVRTKTRLDESGEGVILDVPQSGAFVFIQAEGFRFHGEIITPTDEQRIVKLARTTEKALHKLATLPDPVLPEGIFDLAGQEYSDFFRYQLSQMPSKRWSNQYLISLMHRDLVKLNREAALRLIGDKRLEAPEIDYDGPYPSFTEHNADLVRMDAVLEAGTSDLATALQLSEEIQGTGVRIRVFLRLAENQPDDVREELADKALKLLDGDVQLSNPVEDRIELATHFLEHGNRRTAERLFDEAYLKAASLPDGDQTNSIRSRLAVRSARVNSQRSIAYMKEHAEELELSRDPDLGRIAWRIADQEPDTAEELLDQIEDSRDREQAIVRVCHRMSKAYPTRARQLADSITERAPLRALALALMALQVEDSDPLVRRAGLEEAFAILDDEADHFYERQGGPMPTSVGIVLLPLIEAYDADLVGEFFWRTLSLRVDAKVSGFETLGPIGPGDRMSLSDPVLGTCLARYNLDVARRVTFPPDDEVLRFGLKRQPEEFYGAMAIFEPEAAVRNVNRIPAIPLFGAGGIMRQKAWENVLAMLGTSQRERWNSLMEERFQSVWVPD